MTQADVADRVGISVSHLSRFERGEREISPATYGRIVETLAATAVGASR